MADAQDSYNDPPEEGDVTDVHDYDETTTTASLTTNTTVVANEDYDDEPIEDYVVNLVVNEQPSDLVNAAVTDAQGNVIGTSTLSDSINGYVTTVYDELSGNGTAIAGGKKPGGWSAQKIIIATLVALCIIGIILAIVFLVRGKKRKDSKRPAAGTTTTTKAVVTKGVSPDPKYQPVPNV